NSSESPDKLLPLAHREGHALAYEGIMSRLAGKIRFRPRGAQKRRRGNGGGRRISKGLPDAHGDSLRNPVQGRSTLDKHGYRVYGFNRLPNNLFPVHNRKDSRRKPV